MGIRLRVAGIYYDDIIDFKLIKSQLGKIQLPDRTPPTVDLNGKPALSGAVTILELMEAARVKKAKSMNRSGFTYAFDRRFKENKPGKPDIGFLSMISIGHQLELPIDPSLGDKLRQPGFYSLTEIEIPNGVVAWQNYIFRNEKPISSQDKVNPSPPKGKDGESFTTFDQAILEDNDTVVWRMVAIRRFPDPKNRPEMGRAA
jgi:hypothetical protein